MLWCYKESALTDFSWTIYFYLPYVCLYSDEDFHLLSKTIPSWWVSLGFKHDAGLVDFFVKCDTWKSNYWSWKRETKLSWIREITRVIIPMISRIWESDKSISGIRDQTPTPQWNPYHAVFYSQVSIVEMHFDIKPNFRLISFLV